MKYAFPKRKKAAIETPSILLFLIYYLQIQER